MRIALMTNNYKPFIGGVPISVERLAKGLQTLGHQVTVFAPTYQGYTDPEGSNIIRYSSFLQKFIGGIVLPNPFDPIIEEAFRKQPFDVIHVHHPMLIGRTAVYLSGKYNIPLVFTYHTRYEQYVKAYAKGLPFTERFMPLYLHTFLKHCHHLIAPTEGMKDYLTKELGYDADNVSVLPTGIDACRFQVSEAQKADIRTTYHAHGIPLFLSVSRMANEKNISFLLHAIAAFKARYTGPFRLLMIGDGPCREQYQALCRRLCLDEEVIFVGKVPNGEIAPFYAAADAFLFASKTETQGIVILEAFAGGTPVIALDATGVRDLVQDKVNGFLCWENELIFAEQILEYVSNPVLQKQFSQCAFEAAFHYCEEAVAKKAITLYNRVAEETKLHQTTNRKERDLRWKENITF